MGGLEDEWYLGEEAATWLDDETPLGDGAEVELVEVGICLLVILAAATADGLGREEEVEEVDRPLWSSDF